MHRVFAEHPDAVWDTTGAHYALGDSYAKDGDYDAAERHLRACLEQEHGANIKHNAELRLAEVLVARGRPRDTAEAHRLLDREVADQPIFQILAWRINVARARLFSQEGDQVAAREHAEAAMELLDHNNPRFPRHPDVGLIDPDPALVDELRLIVGH